MTERSIEAVSLDNCEREPIHIPGSIQPHGALIAFDRLGRLSHASANVEALLGMRPQFGRMFLPHELGAEGDLHPHLLAAIANSATDDLLAESMELDIGGRRFDVILNARAGRTICEFELRQEADGEATRFAHLAYRMMDGLKRVKDTERLLATAVDAVRELTGFDRVMAYRFRHDDSGEVVAEARDESLEPYLGRRYPASDIPAQARRLYTLNTLRLIADVADVPVPLLAMPGDDEPLDLSHSVLRSVSPIHVEYLTNMGVGASMSVSIVIGGRLWGMIACHHMKPRRVPYPIRMAVDVMTQALAAQIQTVEVRGREAATARAAWLRTEIAREIVQGTDIRDVVRAQAAQLKDSLRCDGLVLAEADAVRFVDGADPAWAALLTDWLGSRHTALVHVHEAAQLPEAIDANPETRACGVLALNFDTSRRAWLIGLRKEQIQTIRWGGKPEKEVTHGPLGPRLTPRGSFAEWRETVRDTAEPWSATELEIASQLQTSMTQATSDRDRELNRVRSQLWAILGHDLRSPLAALTVASKALERTDKAERMRTAIRNSAHRMNQLVSNVLDISRLEQGMALSISHDRTDLVRLIGDLIEESRIAHPAVAIEARLPDALEADVDPVRFAQIIANLLSNARQHGQGGIRITSRREGAEVIVSVDNEGAPIPDDVAGNLFDPFKRPSPQTSSNPTGMGLGLYIAHHLVRAHGGSVAYSARDGRVIFEVRVPAESPGVDG